MTPVLKRPRFQEFKDMSKHFSVEELAVFYNVSRGTVYNWRLEFGMSRRRGWNIQQVLDTDHANIAKATRVSVGRRPLTAPQQLREGASVSAPSPAMLRLAAFDPVIARAAKQKEREAAEATSLQVPPTGSHEADD